MVGQNLAHYRILGKIGSGGMGDVYLAEDTKPDRKVALKVLPSESAGNAERRARFTREAKAVDTRSDIYSMGVIFYEMATGVRLFEGILRGTPAPVTERNPSVARNVARLIRRCLANDPNRRAAVWLRSH